MTLFLDKEAKKRKITNSPSAELELEGPVLPPSPQLMSLEKGQKTKGDKAFNCLLYTSPSPRDA